MSSAVSDIAGAVSNDISDFSTELPLLSLRRHLRLSWFLDVRIRPCEVSCGPLTAVLGSDLCIDIFLLHSPRVSGPASALPTLIDV